MARRRYHRPVLRALLSPGAVARFVVVVVACFVGAANVGCASVTLVPGAFGLKSVAIASLHARREIGVQSTELAPVLIDGGLGDEVIEMTIADTEADITATFAPAVIVPAGKVMQSKKYDLVPEALPDDEWSQVNRMLAVDVDAAATPAALGVLARDLAVDAVLVVRHEWWLQRDRVEFGTSTWGYDRCTLLLVDDDGQVLWRQTVVTRSPSRALIAGSFQVGFNGGTWADEARSLARETSRLAWRELNDRYSKDRTRLTTTTSATEPPTTTADPPAPLPPTETP